MENSFIKAARTGDLVRIHQLILQGANPDADLEGIRPLAAAALAGHVAIVELLLSQGAQLNRTDQFGNTPLMEAALAGHREVVQLLLKRGAEIEARNIDGETALLRACMWGHTDVVELLWRVGARLNTPDKDGNTPLAWLYDKVIPNWWNCFWNWMLRSTRGVRTTGLRSLLRLPPGIKRLRKFFSIGESK
ncbi:ankyrin repeat domain-containing protein [Desulfomonile tiedjei]|uniref:ankyrin repeat domain-containing protein n=1 Tax=Desulfomonile tiedjei TaxID=2358 RepID=UPI0002E69BFF|nr:ankyrin repeat domain-containing protein [Desulfomonile tiedjei]